MTALLAAALSYAKHGFRVFPCHTLVGGKCSCGKPDCTSPGKHPRSLHGLSDATADAKQIAQWWGRWPDANIGMHTTGLLALDVDPRHGGREALEELLAKHGELAIPDTLVQDTGGGGQHYVFRAPVAVKSGNGKLGAGLDVKAEGAYIIVEPSRTQAAYAFRDWELNEPPPLAVAPDWLLALCEAKPNGADTAPETRQLCEGGRNAGLTAIAGQLRRDGLSAAAIESALLATNTERCTPPLPEAEVRQIAASVSRYAPARDAAAKLELLRSEKGAIKPCEHNARVLITATTEYTGLHFDDFLHRVRIDGRDWTDHDDREVLCWLQRTHQAPGFNLGHARNAILALAFERRRDSLREYVMSLPTWDGVPRIEMAFADAWGARQDPLTQAASRNFFVALIARALIPGAQVDTLWVIEGPQGTLKSASMRALGENFHAEISASVGTADFLRELRGLWIAEMSELDSLRGREASTVKRLLSAPSDRFVEKYQTHAQTYQRRAVAVATTNEATYWQDSTGARRLVPIVAGAIRLDLIRENRLQWLAEAKRLYDDGTTWWEFPASIEAEREERQQIDPWEDTLRGMVAHGRSIGDMGGRVSWPDGWIASAAILRDWLRLEPHQQGKNVGPRLGHVMRRLCFRPHRLGKDRERGWIPDTYGPIAPHVSAQVSAVSHSKVTT